MENFIVSARKYRPSTFMEVVGQDSITRTLKNAIRSEHLAQAFLFTGPRGVGKTTCARILAKTINCLNPTSETEPCNTCESCTTFNTSSSFNIHELDAASNNSVDDIRNLVDQVRIPPQDGKYKVYIIDEVHMLSSSAFNAFLKTLEEPPSYAKFILATTEKHKIIPTILSRCQVYDFHRIRVEDIRSHLSYVAETEQIEAEKEALQVIAQKADGALRDALSIFDQINAFSGGRITYTATIENLNVLDHEYYFRCTDLLLAGDIPGILLLVEEVVSRGFDGHHFMNGLGDHLRNLLMCTDAQTIPLLEVSEGVREMYALQASRTDAAFLISALRHQNQCDLDYKNSNNKRLLLELSLLRMIPGTGPDTASDQGIKKKTEPLKDKGTKAVQEAKPAQPAMVPEPESLTKATTTSDPPRETLPPAKAAVTKSRGSRSTPSILEALASPGNADEDENGEQEDVRGENPVTDFTPDEFMVAWNECIEQLAPEFPSLVTSLRREQPHIGPDAVVRVTLENAVLQETLQSVRSRIHELLRTRLSNPDIILETVLSGSNGKERKPYTSKERFEAMLSKNPSLRELREDFDLDID